MCESVSACASVSEREREKERDVVCSIVMIHPADYYVIYQMGSPHGKKGDMTDKHQTEGKKLDRKRLLG